jgi:hypothetical protein
MGADACIYFKTRTGDDPKLCDALPEGCSIAGTDGCVDGATHEVENPWRYCGPGYEKGPWPSIAAVLTILHKSQDVETVWYFGDTHKPAGPITPQQVQEFSAHYMANGNLPRHGVPQLDL